MPLADRDYLIQDFVGDRNHLQTFRQLRNSYLSNNDTYGIWESNMPYYFLPSVKIFPEIIRLCAENYEPNQRAVKSPSGSILFHISPESINQMLNFKQTQLLFPFSMNYLLDAGTRLSSADIEKVTKTFMRTDRQPTGPPPFLYVHFNEVGKLLVDMSSYVLGFKTSEHIDETVLLLLATYTPGQPPSYKYNFSKFIANKIHDQLLKVDREGVFKYLSYIYHLFMYYQFEVFQCPIKKLDSRGEKRSVIFWLSVFHQVQDSPYSYCEFVDQFVYPVSGLLMRSPPPRLSFEIQKTLQLSKSYKIGDWYLYQNHMVIRIYGCELCPYRLPRYVPMRLFALEYYRQLISSDLTHFHSAKNKDHLKFKDHLGPFIMNKKEGWQEADQILRDKYKLKRSFWWVPYDPEGFISTRRVKYRLLGYDHCKYPQIEQYANPDEWLQGTLVEELTQEEIMEKNVKDLEKTLDLYSVQQVTFKQPHQIGEGASTAATAPTTQGPSTSTTGIEKGKGIMGAEKEVVTEQPVSSIGQQQEQTPPQQTEAPTVPALQTPAHEERGKKRDREESTPAGGSTQQPEAKRQKVDSPVIEEISKEILGSPRKDKEDSQQTATSSFQQEQEGRHGMEVSSFTQQGKKPSSTKATFKEIKAQNELLKVQLYEQFLKATPAKQERLMAAYDIKEEKMILSHFKAKIQQPHSAADFVRTKLEVMAKDIHPMDQIELHKQTGEMVYATLVDRATMAHELKESLKNTNT